MIKKGVCCRNEREFGWEVLRGGYVDLRRSLGRGAGEVTGDLYDGVERCRECVWLRGEARVFWGVDGAWRGCDCIGWRIGTGCGMIGRYGRVLGVGVGVSVWNCGECSCTKRGVGR